MGKSERRELESRLLILLAHLLKWQYQYQTLSERWREFDGRSWRTTIVEQRKQLAVLLRRAPGLTTRTSKELNLPNMAYALFEAIKDELERIGEEVAQLRQRGQRVATTPASKIPARTCPKTVITTCLGNALST